MRKDSSINKYIQYIYRYNFSRYLIWAFPYRVGLYVTSPRSCLAVGFPLLSLTSFQPSTIPIYIEQPIRPGLPIYKYHKKYAPETYRAPKTSAPKQFTSPIRPKTTHVAHGHRPKGPWSQEYPNVTN